MAGPRIKSARAIAVEVLNRCDPKKNYAGTILDEIRHSTGRLTAETNQTQRATDLVFGTLRNRRAIDTVITTFSGRPVKRIQDGLLNIIRVGTYELIYCPSTEQYAIVNEAVVNAKSAGSAKQSGFVNAVLRQITRHISKRQVPLSQAYAQCTLVADSANGCQFDTSFLPDYQVSPTEYLSTVFSLPKWLIAGWLAEFGKESTRHICFASNRRPGIYIRPNRLRTTIEALTEKLGAAEIGFEIVLPEAPKGVPQGGPTYGADAEIIRIKNPRDITQLPGFAEGLFTIQDITASKPVRNLEFRMKNEKFSILNSQFSILDLCAAPGTKTAQLAEVTGDSVQIIATDSDSRRLEMVRENIVRLGINSVDIIPYEELLNSESRFDCILLDVPCSNTGVLARRVEVRYRINPEAIRELTRIQGELLRTAAEMIKPGGKICYSTCSIQKTENGELIEDFLKENQSFTLESEQLTLPSAEGFDHDGGYVAILTNRKIES
jgi:16S rRNA (cytosine967-C5)-methyltransferase